MIMGKFSRTFSSFFEYDAPGMVHIKSYRIGITHRFLQAAILSYIIGFVIIYQKGYQTKGQVTSAVTTKIKGVTRTNVSINLLAINETQSHLYNRIWDPTDYVIPAESGEFGGFFITTNVVVTVNQTRKNCAETHTIDAALCKSDSDCPVGESILIGNGVFTGKCVVVLDSQGIEILDTKTCEIEAWCPVEYDEPDILRSHALLAEAENFTVLVKNVIDFPLFGHNYHRRNILETSDVAYLHRCIYHPKKDPYCPIFRIGDIIKETGYNFSLVAVKGAVFSIQIRWDCDLDWDFDKYCRPKYTFERMDSPREKISPGLNFRTALFHEENRRTLYKHFGIKFLVQVTGEAGKFNAVPFFIHLGSGLGLLNLSTFACNFIVRRCMKKRHKSSPESGAAGDTLMEVVPHDVNETPGHSSGTADNLNHSSTNDVISTETSVKQSSNSIDSVDQMKTSCVQCMR